MDIFKNEMKNPKKKTKNNNLIKNKYFDVQNLFKKIKL